MAIKNYRTTVPMQRTLNEITGLLAQHGAKSIQIEYDQGNPTGVAFLIDTPVGERAFQLPANVDGVARVLRQQRVAASLQQPKHVANVAWRILRDWVDAQMAIVEAGMVTVDQVMLPYLITDGGKTLYLAMVERHLALPAPREDEDHG
jgi:hypothetical protein